MSVAFKDGFAKGFAFAVPEAFADSLAQEDKIKPERFNPGDVFYESVDGYKLEWGQYLKKGERVIQIAGYDKTYLVIKILKPNKKNTELEEIESRNVSPEQLLQILKEGL
jgi:hypothetical protein